MKNMQQHSLRRDLALGTIDAWLIWNLTGGPDGGRHVTDVTNASRTMLMNLETLDWDDSILKIMGIPRSMLPKIVPSSDPETWGNTLADGPFGGEIPVCGDLGDQQAATVGQACLSPGEAKNTYGTGCFMIMNTGTTIVPSASGLLTTLCYKFGNEPAVYALEGSIAITGALDGEDALHSELGGAALESLLHSSAYVAGLDFNHMWGNRECSRQFLSEIEGALR